MPMMPPHSRQPSPRPEAIDMEGLEASFGDVSIDEAAAPECPFGLYFVSSEYDISPHTCQTKHLFTRFVEFSSTIGGDF